MNQFTYGPTGSIGQGLKSLNPYVHAQAENDAFDYQKQHEQTQFERGLMQQEQNRKGQETAAMGQAMQQKYKLLGGLLRG